MRPAVKIFMTLLLAINTLVLVINIVLFGSYANEEAYYEKCTLVRKSKNYDDFIPGYVGECMIYTYHDAVVAIEYFEEDGKVPQALWKVEKDGVVMYGDLGTFTPQMLEQLQGINHKKRFIMYDVPGTYDKDVLLRAIRRIRKLGYDTHVPENGEIASGGVEFFLGGKKRTAASSAEFGIHSWWHEIDGVVITAEDYKKNSKIHTPYLNLYTTLEISPEFYWFTIESASSDGMYWMNNAEIKKYLLN